MSADKPGRGRVFDDITQTIGDTPLVRLGRMAKEANLKGEVLLKLEFFNPLASVKDRIGVSMIDALEKKGTLKPGGTIVEATSGNTGIALAFVAAARGYKCILCMPDSMSRRSRLRRSSLPASSIARAWSFASRHSMPSDMSCRRPAALSRGPTEKARS